MGVSCHPPPHPHPHPHHTPHHTHPATHIRGMLCVVVSPHPSPRPCPGIYRAREVGRVRSPTITASRSARRGVASLCAPGSVQAGQSRRRGSPAACRQAGWVGGWEAVPRGRKLCMQPTPHHTLPTPAPAHSSQDIAQSLPCSHGLHPPCSHGLHPPCPPRSPRHAPAGTLRGGQLQRPPRYPHPTPPPAPPQAPHRTSDPVQPHVTPCNSM